MPGAPLALTGVQAILAFDGRTGYVSRVRGVAIVDFAQDPPELLAEVRTPLTPTTAAFTGEHVLLGSLSGLSVVSPPCGP